MTHATKCGSRVVSLWILTRSRGIGMGGKRSVTGVSARHRRGRKRIQGRGHSRVQRPEVRKSVCVECLDICPRMEAEGFTLAGSTEHVHGGTGRWASR